MISAASAVIALILLWLAKRKTEAQKSVAKVNAEDTEKADESEKENAFSEEAADVKSGEGKDET